MANADRHILILAAGKGRRMNSSTPKVLHPVLFDPMLSHILRLSRKLKPASISVVMDPLSKEVKEFLEKQPDVKVLIQEEQKGTGHAVLCAENFLSHASGRVMVLCGDAVLMREQTLKKLFDGTSERDATETAACLLTAQLKDPKMYGRILRNSKGAITAIREFRDCSPEERKISEINSGAYRFQIAPLLRALKSVANKNSQGEYYLTDAIEILVKQNMVISSVEAEDPAEILGINDQVELAESTRLLQRRINKQWMEAGVTIIDDSATWIDANSEIAPDVTIEPGCIILKSKIEKGSVVEAHCRIQNSHIQQNSMILHSTWMENTVIGDNCQVGPFARLREGTKLSSHVKLGNFVETKKANFGPHAKASHLSYVGDAEIGENVNLGCGFVTCNYDGKTKSKTVIGKNTFVGSDCQTVAPITIGENCYVAAGTTVTEDVGADSLVLSRGRQVTKAGYAKKYSGAQ